MTEHHVGCNPVEPGGEEAVATEGVEFFPGSDVALLGQLFGEVRIPTHPETEAVDPPHRLPIEDLEGRDVTAASLLDRICDNGLTAHGGPCRD